MSSTKKKTNVKCPKCGMDVELEHWDNIDVSSNPELRDKVLKREKICELICSCGEKTDIEGFPFIYHDPINEFVIFYFSDPTENDLIELNNKAINYPYNRLRVVFEYEDLIDKIRIFEANLNDKVIEVCKVAMLRKFGEKLNIPGYFTFFGITNDKNSYVFHNTLFPDEENNKKPAEGSLYMKYPLWTCYFDENTLIEKGLSIEMSKEIYETIESDILCNFSYIQGRWEVVDLNYAIGQVKGENEKNKILKGIEEKAFTDISKLWV